MALDFDKYLASLLPLIPKKMHNQISKSSPLMYMFFKQKKMWTEGGDTIQPHIKYKEADNRGSYTKFDTLLITPQDTRTAAKFGMKQLYASIVFSGYDEAASSGELAVFKLTENALKDAEDTLKDLFAIQLFGNGTGNEGKDLLGLPAYIDDGTNVAVYGGIDRATNEWWKAVSDTATAETLLKKMKEVFAKCSRGGMENRPDFIVCDLDTWLLYNDLVDGKTTIQQPLGKIGQEFANLGFYQTSFMGVPIVYDEYCPADTMYFINSNTVQLWTKEGRDFKPSEMVKPANQDAKIGQIFWTGELVGTEPRANGVLTITT